MQIHTWRGWEEEARRDQYDAYGGKFLCTLVCCAKMETSTRASEI